MASRDAAEQLPRGFTGGFAADIPQSHVDGSNGIDDRAWSAVHAADVQFLPKAFGIERIFADEHFLQAKAHEVLGASMQARAIQGLTSLSPMPVMPSSVWTNMTMSS